MMTSWTVLMLVCGTQILLTLGSMWYFREQETDHIRKLSQTHQEELEVVTQKHAIEIDTLQQQLHKFTIDAWKLQEDLRRVKAHSTELEHTVDQLQTELTRANTERTPKRKSRARAVDSGVTIQ